MGTLVDSLFTVLMSWVRGLVSAIWALFSSEDTTLLAFLGRNWLMIAVVIIAAGLVIDWIIWLLRWQPYHLWAQRARRLLRIEEPEEEERTRTRAHAAVMPTPRIAYEEPDDGLDEEEPHELPLHIDERDAQQAMDFAETAPDEHAYPGMRFDSAVQDGADGMGSTQRYGAVTQEGPGAAEVARRRAEIEAWQQQMQDEARARAEAEKAAREAEQARIAQEAYEAELTQYEREKAQYERELAEYERQKAAYEAQLARERAQQEQAEEVAVPAPSRRRRGAKPSYSDYVQAEAAYDLPDAPAWPQMEQAVRESAQPEQKKSSKLLSRMAKMIEPEEEQLAARTKLPPRVNMQDAYRPAAAPRKAGRRSRNS